MTSPTRLRESNTQRISREDRARNEPAHSGGVGYHTMGLCESVNGGGEKDFFLNRGKDTPKAVKNRPDTFALAE